MIQKIMDCPEQFGIAFQGRGSPIGSTAWFHKFFQLANSLGKASAEGQDLARKRLVLPPFCFVSIAVGKGSVGLCQSGESDSRVFDALLRRRWILSYQILWGSG